MMLSCAQTGTRSKLAGFEKRATIYQDQYKFYLLCDRYTQAVSLEILNVCNTIMLQLDNLTIKVTRIKTLCGCINPNELVCSLDSDRSGFGIRDSQSGLTNKKANVNFQ